MKKTMISRSLGRDEGGECDEIISTKGFNNDQVGVMSFTCHYLINQIQKSFPTIPDRRLYYKRSSDMIRLRGVQVKARIVLGPRSGFRVRAIIFQTPFDIDDMSSDEDHPVDGNGAIPNGVPVNGGDKYLQGHYTPNMELYSSGFAKSDGTIEACIIRPKYSKWFEKQRPCADHKEFQDQIMKMRMTKPNVFVLHDRTYFFANRKKQQRVMSMNIFRKIGTTIKWPRTEWAGMVDRENTLELPDRKIYVKFIFAPALESHKIPTDVKYPDFIYGLTEGSDGDFLFDNKQFDKGDTKDDVWLSNIDEEPVATHRGESMLSDQFDDVMKERVKRRAEKARADTAEPPDTGGPSSRTRSRLTPAPVLTDPDNSAPTANDIKEAFKLALVENRNERIMEREKEKEEMVVDDDVFTSNWADTQVMTFRPTINVWWRDMSDNTLNSYRVKRRRY